VDLEWRIAVMLAALVVGGIGWLVLQRGRGTLRDAAAEGRLPEAVAHLAGERLSLVQVSSEHCTACVRGARILREAIADQAGTTFTEIDASDHMDLVRELGIMTTPTTLVYDGDGALRGRITGAPTPKAALAALTHEQDGVLR
jgi:thiol-disulfide isomerase/thioredoxin